MIFDFEKQYIFQNQKIQKVFKKATYKYSHLVHNVNIMNELEKIKLLGKNIAKYRKQAGYSQNKFAELIDVSREHLAKVETGKRRLSLSLLFKIADSLDVPEKVLFEVE